MGMRKLYHCIGSMTLKGAVATVICDYVFVYGSKHVCLVKKDYLQDSY